MKPSSASAIIYSNSLPKAHGSSWSSRMLSPRQAFDDNMRPAELLLRVYRLLENDSLQTSGDMVSGLRKVVGCDDNEELLLLYNEVFLGLIRERAQIPATAL